MDMDKLIKILGMTGSSHDGEALVALRMAQKLMAAHGKTWKDLIGKPQAQQQGWTGGAGWDPFAHAREKAQREAQRQREREEYARARENAHAREQARQQEGEREQDDAALKRYVIAMAAQHPHLTTDWEKDFLESFKIRPDEWGMTDKQRAIFVRMHDRFRKHAK